MAAIPTVYLVGAGPGDPDLLTVKALRLLRDVDAVVYDKLVSQPILDLIPSGTTRIFAGKTAKNHYMPQQEINELLVSLARNGRRVMRLKGGDPFLFGRGGEEAIHLMEHGIPFEVVPGITSSAGCAAYAGIPLTHRDLAHSVRFVTGHTKDGDFLGLDWKSLADPATTLVVYMGRTNVHRIASELIQAGLAPATPTAAINKGTMPDQRVLLATLATIAETIERADLSGPTLMIIGKVASLTETLAWFASTQAVEAKAQR